MKRGKAFEIIVKNFLIGIGFSEVRSDKLYIYDGSAGQMIQGIADRYWTENTGVRAADDGMTQFWDDQGTSSNDDLFDGAGLEAPAEESSELEAPAVEEAQEQTPAKE